MLSLPARSLCYLLTVAAACFPSSAAGQFNLPLPQALASDRVAREDIQMLYKLATGEVFDSAQTRVVRERLAVLADPNRGAALKKSDTSAFNTDVQAFCTREDLPQDTCVAALQPDALRERLGIGSNAVCLQKGITQGCPGRFNNVLESRRAYGAELVEVNVPFGGAARPALARYMRSSGTDASFNFASQFAASVADDVAYVVTNVVRGLTGRAIFSADYAAVVAREGEGDLATRETIESNKAMLLRAINNGGTLVGRFTVPLYARRGGTGAFATGVTAGAGVIGPVSESGLSRRTGVATMTAEALGSVAIRSLEGDSRQTAELVLGARAGHTQSGQSLLVEGGSHGIAYAQALIGIRQGGAMTVSALISAPSNFHQFVPRLVLNFAAVR